MLFRSNSWKAATSTYHLIIKFPTKYGIGELRGDQVAARECYIVMLEMEDHRQTMCIEEQRIVAELVEGLEEVLLDDVSPEQTTKIGTLASPSSTHNIPKGKLGCVLLES